MKKTLLALALALLFVAPVAAAEAPAGMKIVVVGAGGPMSNPFRTPQSIAVLVDKEMLLFDTGPGTSRNIDLQKLPYAALTQVFFTHYHSDHMADFGEVRLFSRVGGRQVPLGVNGPTGLGDVVKGFELAYEADRKSREAHHGPGILAPSSAPVTLNEFALPADGKLEKVYEKGKLKVFAFVVDHAPVENAVGYRVEYGKGSVVITGDTVLTPGMIAASKGADIIFADAMNKAMVKAVENMARQAERERGVKIMSDIPSYHMDVLDTAKLAADAGAKKLVLVHVTPPADKDHEGFFVQGAENVFKGETVLAKDGMSFEVAE